MLSVLALHISAMTDAVSLDTRITASTWTIFSTRSKMLLLYPMRVSMSETIFATFVVSERKHNCLANASLAASSMGMGVVFVNVTPSSKNSLADLHNFPHAEAPNCSEVVFQLDAALSIDDAKLPTRFSVFSSSSRLYKYAS